MPSIADWDSEIDRATKDLIDAVFKGGDVDVKHRARLLTMLKNATEKIAAIPRIPVVSEDEGDSADDDEEDETVDNSSAEDEEEEDEDDSDDDGEEDSDLEESDGEPVWPPSERFVVQAPKAAPPKVSQLELPPAKRPRANK